MNKQRLELIFLLLITIGCTSAVFSQTQETHYQRIVEKYVKPIFDKEIGVGASVGILKDGKQYLYFFGEKEKGTGVQPDVNTIYEIGSISKTFTASLLAQLCQEGNLKLEDQAKDHLKEVKSFPAYKEQQIQLIHLATHMSGLPRLPDDIFTTPGFNMQNPYEHYTNDMLYAFLNRYELPRAVGSQYEYSNLAAGLLGHILGKTTGSNLVELYQKRIFDPLKMENTFTHSSGVGDNYAVPHAGRTPVRMWDFQDNNLGAGGIKSSLGDMLKYLEANMINPSKAFQLAHQPRADANANLKVGLGWHIIENADTGNRIIWHNGGTAGSKSMLAFLEGKNLGVVMLFNDSLVKDAKSDPTNLAFLIMKEINEL